LTKEDKVSNRGVEENIENLNLACTVRSKSPEK